MERCLDEVRQHEKLYRACLASALEDEKRQSRVLKRLDRSLKCQRQKRQALIREKKMFLKSSSSIVPIGTTSVAEMCRLASFSMTCADAACQSVREISLISRRLSRLDQLSIRVSRAATLALKRKEYFEGKLRELGVIVAAAIESSDFDEIENDLAVKAASSHG